MDKSPKCRILVIPDCHCKPRVSLDHLTWAGRAICEYRPDVVVNLGDFADMPSLSSYDKAGSKYFEGKRYKEDISVAKYGMELLLEPLRTLQAQQKSNKHRVYTPRLVFCYGNHEDRITRAINNNPILEGTISLGDLSYEKDWEVHEYLKPVFINGIGFSHYFPVGAMQRPAATSIAMVNKLHMSCVAGHKQGKEVSSGKRADGTPITCIICGSYYQHDEDYMPDNNYWRGLLVMHEVHDGAFDEMFLSLNYLRSKYSE